MRALLWLIAGGVLYWAIREFFGNPGRERDTAPGKGEEMVRDPQCGVYVPRSSALMKRFRGKTVYFCSKKCEEEYHKTGI